VTTGTLIRVDHLHQLQSDTDASTPTLSSLLVRHHASCPCLKLIKPTPQVNYQNPVLFYATRYNKLMLKVCNTTATEVAALT